MAAIRESAFKCALKLELPDRVELIEQLIDSPDSESDTDIAKAWIHEVDRRAAELDSGAIQGIRWDVLRSRLRRLSRD